MHLIAYLSSICHYPYHLHFYLHIFLFVDEVFVDASDREELWHLDRRLYSRNMRIISAVMGQPARV